jgi:hypothetical protein
VFRYVSIRHTGINVGQSTGNEIQGLTLGGVGAGTVIEYVESYASADDGFEFFGGTVNTKYLVSAFCSDDAFDWDQGFNGKHQFWFAIQAPDEAGRLAEMDGAGGNEQGIPYAKPMISNVTYIGAGVGSTPVGDGQEALIFRDNSGGYYYNSIFTDYDDAATSLGITIEDVSDPTPEDSRKRLEAGDLGLMNNIWYGFGAGNKLAQFAPQSFVQTYLGNASNNNRIVDPMLRGISRETNEGLDPRPQAGSPALTGSMALTDTYFVQTSYVGAFGEVNWLLSWTALDQLGYATFIEEELISSQIPSDFSLTQNYPNPFNPTTRIRFSLPKASDIKLTIYNILGQQVELLVDGFRNAGTYEVNWNASNLPSGIYIYTIQSENIHITKKMTLLK